MDGSAFYRFNPSNSWRSIIGSASRGKSIVRSSARVAEGLLWVATEDPHYNTAIEKAIMKFLSRKDGAQETLKKTQVIKRVQGAFNEDDWGGLQLTATHGYA